MSLPLIGQLGLGKAVAAHVSQVIGEVVNYSGEEYCAITAGGLSGILNLLFARVEPGKEATIALIKEGIFTTPMDGWGEDHGERFIRFVFSNERCHRLKGIGVKVKVAFRYPPNAREVDLEHALHLAPRAELTAGLKHRCR